MRLLGHAVDAGLCANVKRDRAGAASERFDFGDEWREIAGVAAGEDEVGSGARQDAREVLAKATTGSGDKRNLPGEIE
jgi:hypothetical protein